MTHSSLVSKDQPEDGSVPPTEKERSTNWAYRLIPVACVLFIINILMMIASTMADPNVEVNRRMTAWFDRTAPISIPVFVALILGLIFVGFRIDRKQSQLKYEEQLAAWEARMAEKMARPFSESDAADVQEDEV